MAAKQGSILDPFVNGPNRPGAPLFAFLFLIGRHTTIFLANAYYQYASRTYGDI
jgi:hypothetical protein